MHESTTRPAAVAGLFYPGDETELTMTVADLMRQVEPKPVAAPKALIVPHAGYIYSGPIAASAYSLLAPWHARIRRVVLLGPVHRVPVRGLALPGCRSFATPLGRVELDRAACEQLADMPQVTTYPAAHAAEHSLEVHLPFLQLLLDDFKLVPMTVGDASAKEVAEVLERIWGGDETLIVVSSDLSHYLPYRQAQAVDSATCQRILALDDDIDHEAACGATPIRGLLVAAREHGLEATLLDLRNSGDTAGDKARVVGYAAIAFTPRNGRDKLGEALLKLARNAIEQRLGVNVRPARADAPGLDAPGATFVTLTTAAGLRGCIGSLEAQRKLMDDVRENAAAAAFRDPRFPPISAAEWPEVRVEVSLLSAPVAFSCRDEADALRQLRPGEDGLILECGGRRATFLPQVWEQLPEPAEFLAQLKRKAGLPGDFWSPAVSLSRYTVRKWREPE